MPARLEQYFQQNDNASIQWFFKELLVPLFAHFEHWPEDAKEQLAHYSYSLGLTLQQYGWLQNNRRVLLQHIILHIFPRWLTAYPRQAPNLISQLMNALSNFSSFEQQQALLQHFEQHLPVAEETSDTLLVLSWLNGLAQYRASAIKVFQRWPELAAALGFNSLKALKNPWWQGDKLKLKTLPVDVGGMTWLGGRFDDLPWIEFRNQELLVSAGERTWQLFFDAFGVQLQSIKTAEPCIQQPRLDRQPLRFSHYFRADDEAKQVIELPYSYLISFKTSYRLLIIPKQEHEL